MLSLIVAIGVAIVTFVLYSQGAFDSPKKRCMRQIGHTLFMMQRAAKRGDWPTVSRLMRDEEQILRKLMSLTGTDEELEAYLESRASLKEILQPEFNDWIAGELVKRDLPTR